jgi:hypothetical protein
MGLFFLRREQLSASLKSVCAQFVRVFLGKLMREHGTKLKQPSESFKLTRNLLKLGCNFCDVDRGGREGRC